MSHSLSFPSPPPVNLLKAALHRPKIPSPLEIPEIQIEIQEAVLSNDPVYRQLCGFTTPDVPITAPHMLAGSAHVLLVSHPALPLPSMGLVHTDNTITAHQPLQDGMPVRLVVHTKGHKPNRSGVSFDVHTTAWHDGAVIWEETSTYLSRAVKGTGGPRPEEPLPLQSLNTSTVWSLPENLGRRYGRLSGDMNPIHLTKATAKLFGFPRAIIHGMWTLGRAVGQLELVAPMKVRCTFRRPALLPSAVVFQASESGQFAVRSLRSGKLLLNGEALSHQS